MKAPRSIPNREAKADYIRRRQDGYCAITNRRLLADEGSLHHRHVCNSKLNRALYPLFVHSILNLCLVGHDAHMSHPLPKKIPEWRVGRIERGLRHHPGHARTVNMEE